jgi:anti-sigma B factor antagonist
MTDHHAGHPDHQGQHSVRLLRLPEEMTIYHAAAQKEQLLGALADGNGPIEFDAAGVAEIDTAGLQLLLLAARSAAQFGRTLRLVGHSPAVQEVLVLTNTGACFADALPTDGVTP